MKELLREIHNKLQLVDLTLQIYCNSCGEWLKWVKKDVILWQ